MRSVSCLSVNVSLIFILFALTPHIFTPHILTSPHPHTPHPHIPTPSHPTSLHPHTLTPTSSYPHTLTPHILTSPHPHIPTHSLPCAEEKYSREVRIIAVDFSDGLEIYPKIVENLQDLDIGILGEDIIDFHRHDSSTT